MRLQSGAERAILSSQVAQSQLSYVRDHYLPPEHLDYMRYVEEKAKAEYALKGGIQGYLLQESSPRLQ